MSQTRKPDPHDPLRILLEEAAAVARAFGLASGDDLSRALVDRLMLRLGGSYLYVPRRVGADRQRVREEVARRFDGTNTRALALDLGVTVRYVQQIVKDAQRRT
ncbi:Mor transcription activator family protein [uncultured Xylophilus sp.]|uniref:Mor transcription activator family protein n=1 Tax=uncultured Xylophilus sp. TaxID=296832 RepID=UPI0025F68F27|nr:Mor transcription activator family protein [uncultured Xylophilus sp.]